MRSHAGAWEREEQEHGSEGEVLVLNAPTLAPRRHPETAKRVFPQLSQGDTPLYRGKNVALIMPARNEARALPMVLRAVPVEVDRVLVVDNGSTDRTAEVALQAGAQVVSEPRVGYGRACLAALAALEAAPPDIVAFADADGSDDLRRIPELLAPLAAGDAELALASRIPAEPGAMTAQQRCGNWLTTRLIRLLWSHEYADLGPMRAITWDGLTRLAMSDTDYGWTIEMQVRAAKHGLKTMELPLPYLRRIAGQSKVSGTLAAR
jgi:glycosyltransferase involved in cell wall biosynthesis